MLVECLVVLAYMRAGPGVPEPTGASKLHRASTGGCEPHMHNA